MGTTKRNLDGHEAIGKVSPVGFKRLRPRTKKRKVALTQTLTVGYVKNRYAHAYNSQAFAQVGR
jgi:hypothetical protein